MVNEISDGVKAKMKIVESIDNLQKVESGWVLSIGNFDGVHLGHQDIIRTARETADKLNAAGVAVMTFDPHPMAILHPDRAPKILTPRPFKEYLLESCGVDCMIVVKDSYRLLTLSPEDFVDEFLIRHVAPVAVVEGPNFNFGYGRSGDINTLKDLGVQRGFEVVEVEPRQIDIDGTEVMCSSSLLRGMLENGKVGAASKAMGRYYRLMGQTITGRGVGRKLGFPTANIESLAQIVPAEGVYAGFVHAADNVQGVCGISSPRPAAFSIGRAKTFISDHPMLIEAHILQEDVEELGGKWLAMDFVERLRSQVRFDDKDKLKAQIAKDCRRALDILQAK